ncbi:MAG: hydantoinase/oxoprolinase family protein, partial [Panacagrimonas sp.]
GTSYDMSIVIDGQAPAETGWNLHHRYLVGVPMVQVETLGAGGGSICHVHNGALQVGPASAGSEPGPMCYGRGGRRPTITDALMMLGILSTDEGFAGGSFSLSKAGLEDAFGEIGAPLGRSAEETAFDCWRVVNANMSQAVTRTVSGKGIDPKDMVMLAYGGNGPVFAAIQAEDLGITRVLVPKASPTFSALGTLVANPSVDEERSYIAPGDALDGAKLKSLWSELEARARRYFADAGYRPEQLGARYQMKMRYAGQNWSLAFDIRQNLGLHDLSFVDAGIGARAVELFNQRHMAEFGHIRENEMPEVTGLRLVTSIETPSPQVGKGFTAPEVLAQAAKSRRANLGQGYGPTPVFEGTALKPGHVVRGPAIIEETFTTIVVYPGWSAKVDDTGDYELLRVT